MLFDVVLCVHEGMCVMVVLRVTAGAIRLFRIRHNDDDEVTQPPLRILRILCGIQ